MKKILKSLLILSSFCLIASCGNSNNSNVLESSLPLEDPIELIYHIDETLGNGKDANDPSYDAKNQELDSTHVLFGKKIYWLGSSVTYGSASEQNSMADYLASLTGCISTKEAVSGTCIYTQSSTSNSYTQRLVNGAFDVDEEIDAFVCQISTNDAWGDRMKYWGKLSEDKVDGSDLSKFNLATTYGGLEYIVNYVTQTWGCPIFFYSGAYFGDSGVRSSTNPTGTNYKKLIDMVYEVQDKWNEFEGYDVNIIDLYNDEDFNSQVSDTYYKWCRSDAIHPKKAGYLEWWTPYFEYHLSLKLK